MPERSFGRTVRYRRTKLGLSQAKLGELVGRSATTVRSWERDKSHPNDSSVLTALAAILGVDERSLFEKAGQTPPEAETSPTIEQELATLAPELAAATDFGSEEDADEASAEDESVNVDQPVIEDEQEEEAPEPAPASVETKTRPEPDDSEEDRPQSESRPAPAYATPPPRHIVTRAIPPAHEPSYMEDTSQRQLYRVRSLATLVFLVALGIALIWAFGEGLGAIGDWWDDFFGNLRL